MTRRLLILVLLVAGCAAVPPSAVPSVVPSVAPTAEPTAKPSATTAAATVPPLDASLCELAIESGDLFEGSLTELATAIGDEAAMDDLVDRVDQVAESLANPILYQDELHPGVLRFAAAVKALDDASVKHETGEDHLWIEALGEAALAGQAFRAFC